MSNITQVQLTDSIDFQRQRINESIDALNTGNTSISVVNTESSLPSVGSATANIYLIKNHTTYKGSVLALIVDSAYKFIPIKFDPRNGNSYICVSIGQLGSGVNFGKCVYVDTSGIWQLADSTNATKYPIGIVGPNNSIILGDTFYNSALSLTTGSLYYCSSTGTLTSSVTPVQMGTALDSHTLNVQITNPADVQIQSDFNITDTSSPGFIKNKPEVVSKTAAGYVPILPNEYTVTKFLRQDGAWRELPETIGARIDDIEVSSAGVVTVTITGTYTSIDIKTLSGATIAGTWASNVFTPTTATDITYGVPWKVIVNE